MLNIIRADMYRIMRGKALYITLAVLLVLNLIMIISLNAFQTGAMDVDQASGIGVGIEIGVQDEAALAAAMEELQAINLNGVHVPNLLAASMENLVWFLLPIIVVVAAAIFSHGTVKNDIAWGICRVKLYFSKLLLSSALSVVLLIFYIGSGMLIATIINGFGGPAPAGHWVNLLQVLGAQLFMLIAMVSIGVFLTFTTKRTAAVNGIFIAFALAPPLIISLLEFANPNFSRLFNFDMLSNIMRLANLHYLTTRELMYAFGLGAFYLLATTIGGIVLFRRTEIK